MELQGTVQGLSQVGNDMAEQQTGGVRWKTEGTSPAAWKGALQTPGESMRIHGFPADRENTNLLPIIIFHIFQGR